MSLLPVRHTYRMPYLLFAYQISISKNPGFLPITSTRHPKNPGRCGPVIFSIQLRFWGWSPRTRPGRTSDLGRQNANIQAPDSQKLQMICKKPTIPKKKDGGPGMHLCALESLPGWVASPTPKPHYWVWDPTSTFTRCGILQSGSPTISQNDEQHSLLSVVYH